MYVDEGNQVALFSLASVFNNSDSVGENAIGFIDDNQIDKFRNMIRSLPPSIQLIVVTLHHPLFHQKPPAFPTIELQELAHPAVLWDKIYLSDWFLSVFLQNNVVQAKKFYAVLSSELENRKGSSAVVMFGHRHMRSLSTF